MFRNLKCKNTILCELSVIFIPLLIIIAGTIAFILIPNEGIGSAVMLVSLIAALIPLVRNVVHIFSLDITLTSLRNWQKDRLSFETDINGLAAQEVEKAITARALKWGKEQQNPDGAVLTLYKKTKTFNELLPAVHQKLIVYSLQNLTFEDYKVKLAQAQKENLKNISGEETAVALIFLCDRVEQSVLNCVREDCGYNEDEETVVIPLVYDGLTRQYYFNAFYEYNLFVKSTKNYLLDSIKKVVFGGKLPLENNDRFDYSNEISVWQDKTLGDLLDDIKEEEKKEKQFIKNTAEQLTDGQTLFHDDTLYVKYNGKLASYYAFYEEEKPNDISLWSADSWDYPKETEISKKDKAVLEKIAIDYFEAQGKKATFDPEEYPVSQE
jgi:hypothetical protein